MKFTQITILFLLAFLCFAPHELLAQRNKKVKYTSSSKKAIKAFERGITYFEVRDFGEAMIDINKAISIDSNFVEAYILAGQISEMQKKMQLSMYYYRKAAIADPDFYPMVFYILATHELEFGKYEWALNDYQTYMQHPKMDKRLNNLIKEGINRAYFGMDQVKNPVEYDPINLGDKINSENDEYINTLTTDEATLIFTRKMPKNGNTINQRKELEEDFYESRKSKDFQWMLAQRMSSLFNTSGDEGAMNISPDQKMMVFTGCYRDDGFGRCDLYYSEKKGNRWTLPINMGDQINTGEWESNACLSSDGKTVYFARRKGRGESDIYTAERLKDGRWGNVKNLGNVINSIGSEMTPFIHPDGQTLYFASNGHLGMGGFDLFLSRKNEKGEWTEPVNLGYPINDYQNQMGLLINAAGELAYISSDKKGGKGGYDIYSFKLYDQARPISVNYMKGVVADAKTKNPIKAKFELYDLNTNALIVESESDAVNGDFMVVIPNGSLLGLNVSKKGYLFYSEQFEVEGNFSSFKPFLKNVYLNPLQVDQKIILQNIFFASLSYELEKQSFVELKKVQELIEINPHIKIEISGHTDNVGSEKDNMDLSQRRAKAVFDYLVAQGVQVKNLTYKGYGETAPIADNETEEGRSQNRRTELKVIGL